MSETVGKSASVGNFQKVPTDNVHDKKCVGSHRAHFSNENNSVSGYVQTLNRALSSRSKSVTASKSAAV
jgi:hypothetical protein